MPQTLIGCCFWLKVKKLKMLQSNRNREKQENNMFERKEPECLTCKNVVSSEQMNGKPVGISISISTKVEVSVVLSGSCCWCETSGSDQVTEPRKLNGLLTRDLPDGPTRWYTSVDREVELLENSFDILLPNVTCADSGVYVCHLAAPVGEQNKDGEILLTLIGTLMSETQLGSKVSGRFIICVA